MECDSEACVRSTDNARIWYVTDPICGACWTVEPVWRRLKFHYGSQVGVRTVYGGLLPNWEGFADETAGIRGPRDVAAHWDELAKTTGQPIDSSVWACDPIHSSYPPSIAAVAVRRIAPELEQTYLRRLREELFIGAGNIARPDVYLAVASDLGLDPGGVADAIADGTAAAEFAADRELCRALRAPGFPTLFIEAGETRRALFGVVSYAQVEQTLLEVTGLVARQQPPDVQVALVGYGSGTTREFAELLQLNLDEAAASLQTAGAHRQGPLWRSGP